MNQPFATELFAVVKKCIQLKNLEKLFECKKLLLAADFIKESFLHTVGCFFEIHLHSSFLVRCGFIIHHFTKKSSEVAQIYILIFVQLQQTKWFLKLFSLNIIRKVANTFLYYLHNQRTRYLLNSDKTRLITIFSC